MTHKEQFKEENKHCKCAPIKFLLDEIDELENQLQKAEDFIFWLTPCDQCIPPPSYELIGQMARDYIKNKK